MKMEQIDLSGSQIIVVHHITYVKSDAQSLRQTIIDKQVCEPVSW